MSKKLSSEIHKITFKFSAAGWVVAAILMGLMAVVQGSNSFSDALKYFALSAGYIAGISFFPLIVSTYIASRWMIWILSSEERALSRTGKIYYGSLITILIAVGGAGLLVVAGSGIYSGLLYIVNGREFMTWSFAEMAAMLFLGAAYPLMLGVWLEIPMVFLYSHKIKKILIEHKRL